MPSLVEGLRLRVGDEVSPLEVVDRSAEYRPGQGGLPTLRIKANLLAELPKNWQGQAHYADNTYENRLGWREIVVEGGAGIAIEKSTAPEIACRTNFVLIPKDMLSSPLDVT